jgi:hypothetical protein
VIWIQVSADGVNRLSSPFAESSNFGSVVVPVAYESDVGAATDGDWQKETDEKKNEKLKNFVPRFCKHCLLGPAC